MTSLHLGIHEAERELRDKNPNYRFFIGPQTSVPPLRKISQNHAAENKENDDLLLSGVDFAFQQYSKALTNKTDEDTLNDYEKQFLEALKSIKKFGLNGKYEEYKRKYQSIRSAVSPHFVSRQHL